ncbi:hypothetical protein PROFUN_01218 [Planoprotostelium fungivorum]|uniref:Uncharacterized protein n=1 Tax=Planoprotostelium fungivorum TaxID=1890364 RepID=A0A2P6NZF5_9EUKA|nr:hypothetical protein PROFUN_01218 [Planoprotostelium fungivorum]
MTALTRIDRKKPSQKKFEWIEKLKRERHHQATHRCRLDMWNWHTDTICVNRTPTTAEAYVPLLGLVGKVAVYNGGHERTVLVKRRVSSSAGYTLQSI